MNPLPIAKTVKGLSDADLAHTRFGGKWHTDRHRVTKVRIDGGALVYLVPCRLWVPHACATSKTALPLRSLHVVKPVRKVSATVAEGDNPKWA